MRLLLGFEVVVERRDEFVDIDAVYLAGLLEGLGGGVRAEQAVHAEGHEDRSYLGIHMHNGGDGHIGSDHEKTFFLKF